MFKIEIKDYCDTTIIFALGQDIGKKEAKAAYIESLRKQAKEEEWEAGWEAEIDLNIKYYKEVEKHLDWSKKFWKSLPEEELAKTTFYVVAC